MLRDDDIAVRMLNSRISDLRELEREAGKGTKPWREVWDLIKAIGAEFKTVRFASRQERESAWTSFQDAVSSVKETQHRERQEQEDAAQTLENQIHVLEHDVSAAAADPHLWTSIREQIRAIGMEFKRVRLPSHDVRGRLWSMYRAQVDSTSQQAERRREEYQERQRDREQRARESERIRDDIVHQAESGGVFEIRIFWDSSLKNQKAELLESGRRLKEAWESFKQRKDSMLGADKKDVFDRLRKVQDQLDGLWAEYNMAAQQQHAQYLERQAAQQARTLEFIARQEQRITRLYELLARKEAHIRELGEKLTDSRTATYEARVRGWLYEEEQAASDIRAKLQDAEGRIADARSRLA